MLKYDYIIDDLAALDYTDKAGIKKPDNVFLWLWMLVMRKALWSDIPTRIVSRLLSLSVHMIVSVLIYIVFGQNQVSMLAAFLFFLHPSSTDIALWISGRSYGTATIACLLAWAFPPASILFFGILQPNINALFFPLMFLWKFGFNNIYALFVLVLLFRKARGLFNHKTHEKLDGYKNNPYVVSLNPVKIIVALKFYGYYLVNNIFGFKFSFYHSYMDDFADTKEGIANGQEVDVYFFVGLWAAYVLITNLIWNYNLATFGLLWATINFAMWSNFVTVGQQYATNRQTYLANVGLCLMLANGLVEYPMVAGLWLGWYARQLIYSIKQYQNVFWSLFYQVMNEPKFYYSWIIFGNLNFARGAFMAAGGNYQQALTLRPGNFKAYFNLSSACIARGKFREAFYYVNKARESDVYGQEDRAKAVIQDRMNLLNKIIAAKGNIELKVSDIPTIC